MLWTICVILLVLWALGMATSYTAAGLIHILLVLALVVMVIRNGGWRPPGSSRQPEEEVQGVCPTQCAAP